MVPNLADEMLAQSECARRANDPVQLRRAVQLRDLALLQANAAASMGRVSLQLRLSQALARFGARFARASTPVRQA